MISTSSDDLDDVEIHNVHTIESSETIVSDERSDTGNIVTTEIVTTNNPITDFLEYLDVEPIATVEPVQDREPSTEASEPNVPMSTQKSDINQLCFEFTADEANHKTHSTLGDAITGRHTDHSEILKGQELELRHRVT